MDDNPATLADHCALLHLQNVRPKGQNNRYGQVQNPGATKRLYDMVPNKTVCRSSSLSFVSEPNSIQGMGHFPGSRLSLGALDLVQHYARLQTCTKLEFRVRAVAALPLHPTLLQVQIPEPTVPPPRPRLLFLHDTLGFPINTVSQDLTEKTTFFGAEMCQTYRVSGHL